MAFWGQRIKYQFCCCLVQLFKFFIFFALSCADFLSLDLSCKLLGAKTVSQTASSSLPHTHPLLCSSSWLISHANIGCLTIVLGTRISDPQSRHADSSILASVFCHSVLAPVLCKQFLQKSWRNWNLPPVLSVWRYRR